VVKASEALVRLMVNADRDGAVFAKYGVQSMPTILFLDPDGKEVARLKGRDAKSVEAQFKEVAGKYGRNPKCLKEYAPAVTRAKDEGKPLAVFFHDDKPGSQAYAKALDDESLKELYEKIVFVKIEAKKGAPEVKQYNVTSPPIIYVVDPAAEKPESKPYRKIYGQKTTRELKSNLEEALKKAEKK